MSLLSLLSRRTEPLRERAERLVSTANMIGVGCYVPYAKEYTIVYEVDTEHWDWVFTVACVFVAGTELGALPISVARKISLANIVSGNLGQWKSDSLRAYADCADMFHKSCTGMQDLDHYKENPQCVACDGLGRWMFWNLFKRGPADADELVLSRLVGTTCIAAVGHFWE